MLESKVRMEWHDTKQFVHVVYIEVGEALIGLICRYKHQSK